MTLRPTPKHAPDTPPEPPVRTMTSHRDPRAALFVIGLVAASPSGFTNAFTSLATRLADRRAQRQ